MPNCPFCYTTVTKKDIYCPNCGRKIKQARGPSGIKKPSPQTSYRPPSREPAYSPPSREPSYVPPSSKDYYQPRPQRPVYGTPRRPVARIGSREPAPCSDRCIAYCIDSCIAEVFTIVFGIATCGLGCYCGNTLYMLFKDGYNFGQSPGKGAMNIRVINYNTGYPATYSESCIRNCCNCCPPTILCDPEYRHIGDMIAGTMVIRDR